MWCCVQWCTKERAEKVYECRGSRVEGLVWKEGGAVVWLHILVQ